MQSFEQTDRAPEEITDEALAAAVQRGDTEAFGTLMERYESKLLRYGRKFLSRKEDVEDIVQDAFVNAFQNIQSFDTSLRFSPWMYRIAHNAFINELRRTKRRPLLAFDFDTLVAHHVYEDPDAALRDTKELMQHIDKGLEQLSPKYKEVIVLHYIEDLSYKEIADVLEVPIGTVGIRLKRAKEMLKTTVQSYDNTYEHA